MNITNTNALFEQLNETQVDYAIPVFTGTHNKKTSTIKKPVTLRFADEESGLRREPDAYLEEEKSSTERVRRYYKRHPKKVKEYLRKTQDDRVQRNRDRRNAVKKHGKAKMKNHDVHHPNGPGNGWRLAKKDHGRDKKDGSPPETTTTTSKKPTTPQKTTPKKPVVKRSRPKTPTPRRKAPSKKEILKKSIASFILYAIQQLGIVNKPKFVIIQPTPNMTSLGSFDPRVNKVTIIVKGRLLADILRTLAHELVHVKQMQDGKITNPAIDGATGSPIENEANVVAGILMRKYGQLNNSIFLAEQLLNNTIICKKCLWRWNIKDAGDDKYICHRCWNDNTPEYLMEGGAANIDYVLCEECQQKFTQIQYRHLKYKHNMTMDEYVKKHPSAKLIAENAKNYMGTGKNPMENEKSRKKISEALVGTHKCAHFGDKNGMTRPEVREKFMGDRNPAKTTESRKKISEGVKKSYTDQLKKIRSIAFKETRNTDEFRERMYELRLWTRPEDKSSKELYWSVVRNLSNVNYQEYFNEIPNAKKRSREWHLDHKISIQHGFDNKIHPAIIAHPCNLEVVHHSLNESKGVKNSLLYEELVELIGRFDELHGERVLLLCGGAAGHLAHPFEDEELTFADMKEMIHRGLIGGLDQEAPVTEKLDGQNIAFTIRADGSIGFARNKGHIKNNGKNALDVAGIRNMFAGRGNIEKAFTGAAEDLQAAIGKLTPEQIQQMFANGSRFMSLEVILPDTQNVIPYGKSILVLHGTIEYDDEGNELGRSTTDGKDLSDALIAVGAEQQQTFGISGPRTIVFSDAEAEYYQERAERYNGALDRAAQSFALDEDSTLADYRRAWWSQETQKEIERTGVDLSDEEFEGLIRRWADGDKKFGVKHIENPETKKWFREYEKESLKSAQKKMIRPIETVFLQAGADSLRRITNLLSANNPEATAQLKQSVLEAIKAIRDSNDPDKIAKLQRELERLDSIGMDNVVPSEGVVFIYNGKPYKFTGTFAPINQITGTFKFSKPPKETEEPIETPTEEPIPDETPKEPSEPTKPEPPTESRTVAIFTGRFQPFHAGHYSIYQGLVERFGKENVYIASSNVTDPVKSPFDFKERRDIITTMFDIPEDMVVQVKNPYSPVEILEKLPPNTVYVTAVSQKDADRLAGGKYFRNFDEMPDGKHQGFKDQGYFIVAPEMKLNIGEKNISGAQLRAIFGNPDITDRAKQEIFTTVYGKFNPKIFKKIVATTTESEEARKLTDMHGGKKSARVKKAPDEKAIERARDVLKQKVKNPKTNREILVATALKYPPDEPVRKEAERIIQAAMKQNETLLFEDKKTSDNLKVYIYVKEHTEDELKHEIDEYFKNERTLEAFPNLADSSYELQDMIKKAPAEVLDKHELIALQNSDVGDVLQGKDKNKILRKMVGNKKDVKGLLRDIKARKPISMPVVIKHTSGYYLLGGNTRLSVLASLGHTIPVKVLGRSAPFDSPINVYPAKTKGAAAKKTGDAKALFQSILKMRITNPETGNEIKIDTAMDYDKEHSAHKAAMAVIRQRMRGLSNRAGIPKNRKN